MEATGLPTTASPPDSAGRLRRGLGRSQLCDGKPSALQNCDMDINPEPPLGKRILLVEDECAVRDTLRELLRFDHHTVVEANNGAEALRLFAQDRFDAVLTDNLMPFVKGTELAVRIKQLAPSQPILMITAYAVRAGQGNPVNGILRKPFGLDQLRAALTGIF